MSRTVHVTAPSRLHFGLWSLSGGSGRQFGGVGAMVEQPGLALEVRPWPQLVATGPLADRAVYYARRWAEFHGHPTPSCQLQVVSAAPQHVGLGIGTQLALSIAAGLNRLCGLPSQTSPELALSVGRGLRSAVGTYGFVLGGLIVEQGKLPGEPVSPLDCRIELPDQWRFVLARPTGLAGLAGDDEASAIASLPAVPPHVTELLVAEVREQLVPGAATADFPLFAESLYRYGNLSGRCFAPRQGGPYNGPLLTRLVEQIRSLGAVGVGQSSWGPTLFAVQPSQAAAEQLAARLQRLADVPQLQIVIAPPCNRGARIDVIEG
jgi:beta-RFAP synthase